MSSEAKEEKESSNEEVHKDDENTAREAKPDEETFEDKYHDDECDAESSDSSCGKKTKKWKKKKKQPVSDDEEQKDSENATEAKPEAENCHEMQCVQTNDGSAAMKINEESVANEEKNDIENERETNSDTEMAESTDSDSEDGKHSSPKTLEDLGIKLNKSNHIWRSHKNLNARQLGFISPVCFTRNVTGSVNMVERFKLERKLESHNGCVNTLNFNSSGDLLASGSDDLDVIVWDWAKGKKKFRYESGHSANVFQAKFMPNTGDSIIVTCARDGQVRVGYLSSLDVCQSNKRLTQHKAPAHKLSIEPGSPYVFLTCGEDSHVIQIDLREDGGYRKLLCRGDNKNVPLYTISINPAKPQEFAVGGRDQRCRVYDRRHLHEDINDSIEVLKEYCPHHLLEEGRNGYASVTCLMYSHDGSELLVSYNDEDIYLFDAMSSSNAEHIHRYKGHRNSATVKGVNFYGTRSEFIVSGSDCGHVFLWDKETESVVQLLKGDEAGVVNCLEPHPLYPVLATSGLDHDVKIWTPTSHEPADVENMKSVIIENDKERDEERRRPHDPISEDLLWLMVNHITRRRFYPTESDSDDSSDDGNDGGSEAHGERVQCYPS